MRSSLASVNLRAIAHARAGRVTKCRQSSLWRSLTERRKFFKDVCEEQNVHEQVVVVLLFHGLHAVARPHPLRAFVILSI